MTPAQVYSTVSSMDRPLTRKEAQEYLLTLAVLNAASDEKVRATDIAQVLTASAAGAQTMDGKGDAAEELLGFIRDKPE